LAGGPLTKDLATPKISGIKTPFLEQIKKSKPFGYYWIDRVQMEADSSFFIDIWILASRAADKDRLQ